MTDIALIPIIKGEMPANAADLVASIENDLKVQAPTALARATGLLAWKMLWLATRGDGRGGDRKSAAWRRGKIKTENFAGLIAGRLGLGERAVFLDIALAEDLGARDIERLWRSKVADNATALRIVARIDAASDKRDRLVKKLASGASLTQALVALGLKPEVDSDDAAFERLYDAWKAASARVQRRFLAHLGFASAEADQVVRPRKVRGAA